MLRFKINCNRSGLVLCPKDITDGLVGYWKLDKGTGTTIADSSGQNNNGTAIVCRGLQIASGVFVGVLTGWMIL